MEFLLTLILALMVAIVFNYGKPKFDATSWGGKLKGNFYGTTFATALVFLAAIYLAAIVASTVGLKSKLPA